MTFEWTISIGAILSVMSVVFATGIFYAFTKSGIDTLRVNVSDIQSEMRMLREVVTSMAVQTERINNLSGRVERVEGVLDDLKRGKGFIRETIDREYK